MKNMIQSIIKFYLITEVIGGICQTDVKNEVLSIFHTNDFHSRFVQVNKNGGECSPKQINQGKCYGGLARMKSEIDELRQIHPNHLLLDAGDQFQGTLFFTYFKGNLTSQSMNMLKYDAMTIGNHEFDQGSDNLARVASEFQFPLVSSNVNATRHPTLGPVVKRYHLFPKHDVALIGYLTYNATQISNIGGLVTIQDPVKAVQEVINEVRGLGYKRVIAISHNGYKDDLDLASKVEGLSLIIGGHTHSYLAPEGTNDVNLPPSEGFYPTPVKDLNHQTTYVVQAYCWGRFLGHIDITFNDEGYLNTITGSPIELNSNVTMDDQTQNSVMEWKSQVDNYTQTVIGKTTTEFESDTCSFKQCEVGKLITGIMHQYRPKVNFAFLNSASLRSKLPQGNITIKDILAIHPYSDPIVELTLSGQQILDMIQTAITKHHPTNSREVTSYLQSTGLNFTNPLNPSSPPTIYNPITQSYTPLLPTSIYQACTLNFVANGGDNLIPTLFPNQIQLESLDTILIDYFQKYHIISPLP